MIPRGMPNIDPGRRNPSRRLRPRNPGARRGPKKTPSGLQGFLGPNPRREFLPPWGPIPTSPGRRVCHPCVPNVLLKYRSFLQPSRDPLWGGDHVLKTNLQGKGPQKLWATKPEPRTKTTSPPRSSTDYPLPGPSVKRLELWWHHFPRPRERPQISDAGVSLHQLAVSTHWVSRLAIEFRMWCSLCLR